MPSAHDYRSFELEAAAATSVARGRTALGSFLKLGVPIGALLVAAWMIYDSVARRAPTLTTPDKEEFTTTQFPAPSLAGPRTQTNQGTIVIPRAPPESAPPPPPVAPPLALPAPPPPEPPLAAAPPNDDEARRLAELERQRQEEERRKWERLRAPQVITDNAAASAAGNAENASSAAAGADDDPNRRFLASVSAAGVEVSRATKNSRIDALVAQGTMIRGVLETALQSDLPGMVRAVVSENVWSFDGRRVLIPAGSRLVGEYKSGIAQGQTRVFVVWTRMLRSDGVSVQLGSNGTDDLGRAGNAGFVDNHYLERFGSAIMLSLVGGVSQFLSGYGQNTSNTGNGTIITTTDPVTGAVTQTQTGLNQNQLSLQARQIAAQNVSQTLTTIAREALRNSINIPPTIHLDQGTRIIVFVRRDLDFSALYPDPVKEALRELKRERTGAKRDSLH
ncbi:type IV secretion system protein VirB10 [Bradyrhizobium betae]|uniref:TrbI/VirB10 family protein n=1 Tax=Bradyrhizobium betae TaxID=244734 RepID=A0A5P6PGQ3_9BRAD|nr:type IV secretion system protein VirB10 [Bradyrhizobium betae]MCS3731031.1 type IV secretion system protein VirB10 [Bradyrhizobium betae]QFI77467.1 TrbI/VirB10 family protein [Bradyrhizobium betae]